jgi:MoaA/NifB/PqqE/SkfB family radical SAM enzyme
MHAALRHVPSLLLKRRPVHLTFFATRRCNARCPFCFYAHARDAEGGPPELSLDEVRRVARSMDRLLWVLFSGGEPFLRDDLVELSAAFHDATEPTFLTLPTNGLLPAVVAERTAEILRRCERSVVVVKLSLDGVGRDHDALRRVPGAFDKVMEACERLAPLVERFPRLEVGVNTVFCPENQWRMDGLVDLVRSLPAVSAHTVAMIRGPLAAPPGVDLAQYERVVARLEERWGAGPRRHHRFAGGRLKAAQDAVQRGLVRETLARGRRVVPCQAGRLNLVLTESGELHPCEGRWDLSFGNVRDARYDVRAMLRAERAARVVAEIARGACHCTRECNLLTNILCSPTMHPGLLREYARQRLGIPRSKPPPADRREARTMVV